MKAFVAIVLVAALGYVEPHGYLKIPIARTSIQLAPEFNTQQPTGGTTRESGGE